MLSDNTLNDLQVRKEGCLTWAAMPNRCAGHRKAVGKERRVTALELKAVRYITWPTLKAPRNRCYHPSMMADRTTAPKSLSILVCVSLMTLTDLTLPKLYARWIEIWWLKDKAHHPTGPTGWVENILLLDLMLFKILLT
jgi:hypothetical protein